jgi:hypothetical protein
MIPHDDPLVHGYIVCKFTPLVIKDLMNFVSFIGVDVEYFLKEILEII